MAALFVSCLHYEIVVVMHDDAFCKAAPTVFVTVISWGEKTTNATRRNNKQQDNMAWRYVCLLSRTYCLHRKLTYDSVVDTSYSHILLFGFFTAKWSRTKK